jgi:hypothetical protein
MAQTCRNHCRQCNSHFSSLDAFDAHRPRNSKDGGCEWPEDAPLSEIHGAECRISDPSLPVIGVTVYEHVSVTRARERREASAA